MKTFAEFLQSKSIEFDAFKKGDSSLLVRMESEYSQVGENSFDHKFKFHLNNLRHEFPLSPTT